MLPPMTHATQQKASIDLIKRQGRHVDAFYLRKDFLKSGLQQFSTNLCLPTEFQQQIVILVFIYRFAHAQRALSNILLVMFDAIVHPGDHQQTLVQPYLPDLFSLLFDCQEQSCHVGSISCSSLPISAFFFDLS